MVNSIDLHISNATDNRKYDNNLPKQWIQSDEVMHGMQTGMDCSPH
jgi:hypothetical protein